MMHSRNASLSGNTLRWIAVTVLSVGLISEAFAADEILVSLRDVPPHGLAIVPLDLTDAMQCNGCDGVSPAEIRGFVAGTGQSIPLQFIPSAERDARKRAKGLLVARLPAGGEHLLRLKIDETQVQPARSFDGKVKTSSYVIHQDRQHAGGFPWRIELTGSGKAFDGPRWNDRLHVKELGSFHLHNDPDPAVELVSSGPVCTVIRVRGQYQQPGRKLPASLPEAVYDWHYFSDFPWVFVTATIRQREPLAWREAHFLELNFRGKPFPAWAGAEPASGGSWEDAGTSHRVSRWAIMTDGHSGIGMCGADVLLYDGNDGYGKYLHACGENAWRPWDSLEQTVSAWLWIGCDDKPAEQIQTLSGALPSRALATVTTDRLRSRLDEARRSLVKMSPAERCRNWMQLAAAEQLQAQGRLQDALAALEGQLPAAWKSLTAGDLGLLLDSGEEGIRLVSLFDASTGCCLSASKPLPLFELTLQNKVTGQQRRLAADAGWSQVDVRTEGRAHAVELQWRGPKDSQLGELSVVLHAEADPATSAIRWTMKASGQKPPWSLWQVAFPRVALSDGSSESCVLTPRGSGVVKPAAGGQAGRYRETYPNGWCTMQFQALYDPQLRTGLYVAAHDPWASTKIIEMESRRNEHAVAFAFEHPVADMGEPENRFELSGQAVWQLLHGDWYDAAVIYRDWVRREARWYPRLSDEGRDDTPLWMRELCVWAQSGSRFQDLVPQTQQFAKALDLPTGLHWYNWHAIPFDNDYPHYFPAKENFAEQVRLLKQSGVYVMPYINGRLWDTRDRGSEDFEFTRVARPAATKDEKGSPYTEMYGSKESDGSRVALAVMCPTTKLWQEKLREIDRRLFEEMGVQGVYMDQIAAAAPALCFDRSHGHPLGGGRWWTEQGYWPMLEAIRQALPKNCILTTECNAEPYLRWFDGYLTWHWQHDGQVPAFPAVYGGAVQMFGRAYGRGPNPELALRMKAGQQLVFGEQIGWMAPQLGLEQANLAFLQQVVRLRWKLRRYFYAGEMARPPKLSGSIPTVTADWQWHGTWPVTTEAVMTGAWRLPKENRLVLLFVNVGDEPLTTRFDFDSGSYGIHSAEVQLQQITADGGGKPETTPASFSRPLTIPAHSAIAWELSNRPQ